jgi:hypothetical protein
MEFNGVSEPPTYLGLTSSAFYCITAELSHVEHRAKRHVSIVRGRGLVWRFMLRPRISAPTIPQLK